MVALSDFDDLRAIAVAARDILECMAGERVCRFCKRRNIYPRDVGAPVRCLNDCPADRLEVALSKLKVVLPR